MAERIYVRNPAGGVEPVREEPFSSEDELQQLIASHPELLDGEQMRPDDPRRWVLITREKGIAVSRGDGARWALDHLIVDQDARPTLVEVKLRRNTDVRRTVVGQLLEYAANAATTWSSDELRACFEATTSDRGQEPARELAALLDTEDPDPDAFWDDVATNLIARRLRLLFVADDIPDELERIVLFLNASMPDVEVLAVELKQYRNESSQTLVPRVIGRSADTKRRRQEPRRVLNRDSFLAAFSDPQMKRVATRLLDAAVDCGGRLDWGLRGVSLRGPCPVWPRPLTVAWLYPPGTPGWMKTRDCTFGASVGEDYPPQLREVLSRWIDQFEGEERFGDASSEGVEARWAAYDAIASRAEELEHRLASVFAELSSLD